MDRHKSEGGVANDFKAAVRHVAQIDRARSCLEFHLFAVRRFDGRALDHIKSFLAVMDVARDEIAGLILNVDDLGSTIAKSTT